MRLILLAALALVAAGPVAAQTTAASPPVTAPAMTDAQAAFQAKADGFGQRIQTMAEEMQQAVTAAGADTAKRDADLDAIAARYQPEVDSFANDLRAFVDSQAAGLPADQAEAMKAGVAAAIPQITGVIGSVRAQIVAGAASAPPAS